MILNVILYTIFITRNDFPGNICSPDSLISSFKNGKVSCTTEDVYSHNDAETADYDYETDNADASPNFIELNTSELNHVLITCLFTCDNNYRLAGHHKLTCSPEGWDYSEPTCIKGKLYNET